MSGYIKLFRSIVDWEFWDDHNTTRLLVYLLVSVNHEPKVWRGVEIKAGELITSYEKLATATGLTVSQVRRSLSCLEHDKQITRKTTNKHQAVTLVKWEELQLETKQNRRQKSPKTATTKEVYISTNVDNIQEDCSEKSHSLIFWIEKNAPIVNKMAEPFTVEQAEKIKQLYNAKHTAEILEAMHNHKRLLTDNQSAYLTFLNWMRRRQMTDATYGLKQEENDKPKFKAAWQ